MHRPETLFISYSRKGKDPWLERVIDHLAPLKNEGLIEIWNDQDIEAGAPEPWEDQLRPKMKEAGVLVVLLRSGFSAYFEAVLEVTGLPRAKLPEFVKIAHAFAENHYVDPYGIRRQIRSHRTHAPPCLHGWR